MEIIVREDEDGRHRLYTRSPAGTPRAGERLRKGGEYPIESHVFDTHERVIGAADGLFGGPNPCSGAPDALFGGRDEGFCAPDALFGRPNLCSSGQNACSGIQNQRFFPPESPVFQGFFVIPDFL